MDRSRKGSVASTSPKHSSTPKFSVSGKTDENKNKLDLMDSSQNPQRTFPKHFMSPTVSTAAKSSFPRNKIMSAKKDTPFDIPLRNSLNLEDAGPAQEGITRQENQTQLVGGGMVKVKVERGKCSLKPVSEFIFLLTIIALSTSYMCSPKNNSVDLRLGNILVSRQHCWFSICTNIIIQKQNCTNVCPGNRHVGCRSVVHHCVLQLKTEVVKMADGLNNDTFGNNVGLGLRNVLVSEQHCWFSICTNVIIQHHQSHMNCTNLCPGNRHMGCRNVPHCVLQLKTEVVEMAQGLNNDTFDPNNEVLKNSPRAKDIEQKKLVSDQIESKEAPVQAVLWAEVVDADNNDTSREIPKISSETFQKPEDISKERSSETEKTADLIDEEHVSIGLIEEMNQNMEDTTSLSHETTKQNDHNGNFHSTVMDSDDNGCDQLEPMLKYREGTTAAYIVPV